MRDDGIGVPGGGAGIIGAVVTVFERDAAPAGGAGCGLRCGVESPQTTQAGDTPRSFTSGVVKRVALLVTMPQAMSRAPSSCTSSDMPGNSRVWTQIACE